MKRSQLNSKVFRYQYFITLQTFIVLEKVMGTHRKRPAVMKRWRKLDGYMHRSINGSGSF